MKVTATVGLYAALCLVGCASQPTQQNGQSKPVSRTDAGVQKLMSAGIVSPPVGVFLASLDQDMDFIVSRSELQSGSNAHWERANTDGRPNLSTLEIDAWLERALGSSSSVPNRLSFDIDMSGSVDQQEFITALEREFKSLDANNDSEIARSELLIRLPRRPNMSSGGRRSGMRPPSGQKPPGGMRPPGGR